MGIVSLATDNVGELGLLVEVFGIDLVLRKIEVGRWGWILEDRLLRHAGDWAGRASTVLGVALGKDNASVARLVVTLASLVDLTAPVSVRIELDLVGRTSLLNLLVLLLVLHLLLAHLDLLCQRWLLHVTELVVAVELRLMSTATLAAGSILAFLFLHERFFEHGQAWRLFVA
jgi:hypothetical protein